MNSTEVLKGLDPFSDMDIPPELEDSLQRHRTNLARLIVTLRSAGISEQQIEESVAVVILSYKEELTRALKSLVGDRLGH